MSVDPILESPGARQHAREPIATVGRLGGGEQLPSMVNESAPIPSATGVPEQQAEANPEQQAERALERHAKQKSTMEEPIPPP